MNKYILFGFLLIVIITLLLIFFKKGNVPIIKSPKELALTYKMSAGIPFRRVIEIEDESIVRLVKSYVSKDENTGGKVGAPVYMTYVFKGLKAGTTTITYKVVSIDDENDAMSEEKNIVIVDEEGNIRLINE